MSYAQPMQLLELGPRTLSTDPGAPFVLSSKEWIAIQVGMENILRTAPDLSKLGDDLKIPSETALSMANGWHGQTRDQTLVAGKNIRDYGRQVSAQYPEVIAKLDDLLDSGKKKEAKTFINSVLNSLKIETTKNSEQATLLAKQLDELDIQASELQPIFEQLQKKYDKELGEQGAAVKELRKELAAREISLAGHNAEYDHYVVIAATTPTYAWVPFVGWIAAGTVAGVYGKKAADAKKAAEADARRISEIRAEIDEDEQTLANLELAKTGLGNISTNILSVIPVVQHIKGNWVALDSDLDYTIEQIGEVTDQEDIALLKLSFEMAIELWEDLADEAEGFLKNAHVLFHDAFRFGTFETKLERDGVFYKEKHTLRIDFEKVFVNNVPVENPVFTPNTINWNNQTNASRANKPYEAYLMMSDTGFAGACTFLSGEDRFGWTGTLV